MRKFLLFLIAGIFLINLISASRLPIVNGDEDSWGTILNDLLSRIAGNNATELNLTMVNGTNIYPSAINSTHIVDNTIAASDIGLDVIDGSELADTITLDAMLNFINNSFAVNTSDLFVNVSTGNIGLNTITPQNILNVVGDINATGLIYGNGSQLTGLSLTETDPLWTANWTADQYLLNIGDTATGNYTFDTNTFHIDSTNNRIGIGTTDPGRLLEVREASFTDSTSDGIMDVRSSAYPSPSTDSYAYGIYSSPVVSSRDALFTKTLAGFISYPKIYSASNSNWTDEFSSVGIITSPLKKSNNIGSTFTITSATGLLIEDTDDLNTVVLTNLYGIYLKDLTYGDNNYGLYFEGLPSSGSIASADGVNISIMPGGDLGVNTTTPQNTLNVVGDINATGLFYGNGSQLTGISVTETDPLWGGNSTLVPYLASANVFTANQNLTGQNITAIDCIIFDSGGKICSGS